jgi:tetratricopeptide (TPR) repeat protein
MKEIDIKHLAYYIKQAKKNNEPQPIFFLGAGASCSGNIPLADGIKQQILIDFADSPFIKDLPEENRTYANLMNCLQPYERNKILKKYIDNANINVAHIYLAQLINEDYADYVLTVNFDNLMLRALALFNIFPPTYDLAILNDLTTSTFKEKSIVYLHGQNHGLWLLNTPQEMDKVKNIVPRIFDTIKNNRPWIFIGYSGEDPIFEHIKKLGRFDNGIYWVSYKDNDPNQNVQKLLNEPNINSYIIKGYDADSFMLKLNTELGLGQPVIIDKPFSALKNILHKIVDIEDEEHFQGVKVRIEISKNQIERAIQQFELGLLNNSKNIDNNKIDILKKEIINLKLSGKFIDKNILEIEEKIKGFNDDNLLYLLSDLYMDWGIEIGNKANNTKVNKIKETNLNEAISKYQKAIEINPNNYKVFYNWGNDLIALAELKDQKNKEKLYLQAALKLQQSIDIKPNLHEAYYNWGIVLTYLAQNKNNHERKILYLNAITKLEQAVKLNPTKYEALYSWGISLMHLAENELDKAKEDLYNEAINLFEKSIKIYPYYHEAYYSLGNVLTELSENHDSMDKIELIRKAINMYNKVVEINPNSYRAYVNWGNIILKLAEINDGEIAKDFYNQAFEKYQKAIDIKSDLIEPYNNWAVVLVDLAKKTNGKVAEEMYQKAFEMYKKAISYGAGSYNLSCLFAIKGEKTKALELLKSCLEKKEISPEEIKNDNDWDLLKNDVEFQNLLNKHK